MQLPSLECLDWTWHLDHGRADKVTFGHRLGSMILEISSDITDSVILCCLVLGSPPDRRGAHQAQDPQLAKGRCEPPCPGVRGGLWAAAPCAGSAPRTVTPGSPRGRAGRGCAGGAPRPPVVGPSPPLPPRIPSASLPRPPRVPPASLRRDPLPAAGPGSQPPLTRLPAPVPGYPGPTGCLVISV